MRFSLKELAKAPEGTLTVCYMAEVHWDTGKRYHGFAGPVLMAYVVGDNGGLPWSRLSWRPAN